ncbi:PREDICTED: trinucleotide repeat-containing gene 6B protein-like isoform X2 [Amphimedon queenslandica]|uniref:UBA domain-containing protein n=1 Tax=Amphimedon queenslandica TaxID=400682 RepID=A0AAN0IWR2_AMPQE|nr:PREDICTED: trinucleotide repeat-containing gene 6B protein-like isoform X2 [Amphimedon queenslandica]|eukprot:XP_019849214.1 PREDICTED: trinucleotide repeat-containing gene 6B protein-like isoform X2 [Amphimedon queenslandica]
MTTAMVDNSILSFPSNNSSVCSFPHYAAAAASGSKKSKETTSSASTSSTKWPPHSSSSAPDSNWSNSSATSPDSASDSNPSIQSNKFSGRGSDGPWNNQPRQQQSHDQTWPSSSNHWVSDEDSYSNSDPITEEGLSNEMSDGFQGSSTRGPDKATGGGRQLNEVWEDESARQKKHLETTSCRDVKSPSNESVDGGGDSTVGGEGGGVWRSRNSMGSTSSVNSVGSSSSWKTSNTRINNYNRSNSPRKGTGMGGGRYESHRSLSVSSNGGGGIGRGSSRFSGKKKPVMDLDDAIESLHSEPSGWGDLPSPKPTGIDTGTEVWGIPDDVKQKMKKDKPHIGGGRGQSWSDTGDEWGGPEVDQGWNGGRENGSEAYQWETTGPGNLSDGSNGWSTVSKGGKERSNVTDKVKLLVDMGFSPSSCEKVLKMNNNNIEAALGDLLALSALKEDDQELSSAPPPSLNLAPPIKSNETGPSPPPSSSSSHYFIATSSTSSSPTPPLTPSLQSPWNHRPPSVPSTSMLTTPTTNSGGAGGNVHTGLDLVNLQQVLGQQLNQYLLLRQRLMIQISQLKAVPQGGGAPQHQFLMANLNQINTQIKGAHQQLALINQMILKQQQHLSPDDKDEKDNLVLGGVSSEATPTTSGIDVSVSMQSLSLDPPPPPPPGEVGKLSARNLSRLQKVMTSVDEGSSSGATITGTDDTSTLSQSESILQEDANDSPPLLLNTSTSTTSTVSSGGGFTSSGRFSSVRSVDEIPEFKPGVPWNPHSSKPHHSLTAPSTPSGPSGDYTVPGMYGAEPSEKSYSAYNRGGSSYMPSAGFGNPHPSTGGIVGMDSKFQGTSRFSSQAPTSLQFNRSNSYNGSSNSFYANSTVGGGVGSSSAYKGYGVGMQQGQQSKYHPQQSQMHVQQPSSFSRRPKLGHQHSYSGYSSTLPPTPTGGNYGGRSSVSGGSYRGNGGSYGQQQQNKWTFDGNPWGMPATSGSIWSMESSDSLLNTTASSGGTGTGYNDWRGGGGGGAMGRKPSLPLQLSPHNSFIVLRNVTPQIDETSLREVCSEYGKVLACTINSFNESVLIRYSTKEEAALAKSGLDRNPSICGVYVNPQFASEADISSFSDQRTPSSNISLSSAFGMSSSWLPQRLPHPSPQPVKKPASLWGTDSRTSSSSDSSQMSLWGTSDSSSTGLTSLSSPWGNSVLPPTPSQPLPTAAQREEGSSHQSTVSSSPPLSTFLPNGLF